MISFMTDHKIKLEVGRCDPLFGQAVVDLGIYDPLEAIRRRRGILVEHEVQAELVGAPVRRSGGVDADLIHWDLV